MCGRFPFTEICSTCSALRPCAFRYGFGVSLFTTAKVYVPLQLPRTGDVRLKNLHPLGRIQAVGFRRILVVLSLNTF